jgi:hypothetical protein
MQPRCAGGLTGDADKTIDQEASMTNPDTPKDRDFAAQLEGRQARPARSPLLGGEPAVADGGPATQTLQQVLVEGEEPTGEFIEGFIEAENAPPVSDEELERQALEAPGGDGDPRTPE